MVAWLLEHQPAGAASSDSESSSVSSEEKREDGEYEEDDEDEEEDELTASSLSESAAAGATGFQPAAQVHTVRRVLQLACMTLPREASTSFTSCSWVTS